MVCDASDIFGPAVSAADFAACAADLAASATFGAAARTASAARGACSRTAWATFGACVRTASATTGAAARAACLAAPKAALPTAPATDADARAKRAAPERDLSENAAPCRPPPAAVEDDWGAAPGPGCWGSGPGCRDPDPGCWGAAARLLRAPSDAAAALLRAAARSREASVGSTSIIFGAFPNIAAPSLCARLRFLQPTRPAHRFAQP